MNLQSGQSVTIEVRNSIFPRRKMYASYMHIPETTKYTGTITPSPDWDHNKIGITTGNARFPVRYIDKEDIVGNEVLAAAIKNQFHTWLVDGSKGNQYTVTNSHGQWSCTCPGFGFRRMCKHVSTIKENGTND